MNNHCEPEHAACKGLAFHREKKDVRGATVTLPRFTDRSFSVLLVLWCLVMASSAFASAPNVYIAQNAAGGANGSSCANAYAVSFFNNSANWGSASTQIGPGTTVYLCGTITTTLGFQGSGTGGNPITLAFTSGAAISVPTCGTNGCINIAGGSYLLIDGGTNGVIQATNSGTGMGSGDSIGVNGYPGITNCEIRNLTITNMYVHSSPSDDDAGTQYAIHLSGTGNLVHNNTINNALAGIVVEDGSSGNQYYSNTISNINWGIFESAASLITNEKIYLNDIYNFAGWDTTDDTFHHDGIFLSGGNASNTLTHVDVYDNYVHGTSSSPSVCASSSGSCLTAFIYINTDSYVRVFNNLLVANAGDTGPNNGWILMFADANDQLYNNTVIGGTVSGNSNCALLEDGTGFTFENNVLSNCNNLLWLNGATITTLGYNTYQSTALSWRNGDTFYSSLSSWESANGETSSQAATASLNLSSTGIPQSGSILIATAANLTSLGIPALDFDAAGTARPATGAWVAGAYGSGTTGATTYTLSVVNGIGGGNYAVGAVASIAANAAPAGQTFLNWTGATVQNSSAASTSLTMPASNATVTATYTAPTLYALTVANGTGSGTYAPGTVVTITADSPPAGSAFLDWSGATVASSSTATTTITMPAASATVTAQYTATAPTFYTLTVASGTGSGTYAPGAVVTITANAPPAGSAFLDWSGATVATSTSATTTLTMPASSVTVTANYKAAALFALTVTNGTGSGTYAPGAVVTITANTPPKGEVFMNWTSATVANSAMPTTTLTMPAANTKAVANFHRDRRF